MPRYTMCPFYVDENKKSISCEDICRTYKTLECKYDWMTMYCDSWEWMKCPYAIDRSEAYAAYEKGDVKALENQEIKALEKENKYLRTLLGKAEKRVERQQRRIDLLHAENKSFCDAINSHEIANSSLERQKKEFFKRWRDAQEELENYKQTVAQQVQQIADAYETRLAYLVDKYGTFSDLDVDEWRQNNKAFALVYDTDDDGYPCWKVVFKEYEPDKDIQTDVQEGKEVRQSESTD